MRLPLWAVSVAAAAMVLTGCTSARPAEGPSAGTALPLVEATAASGVEFQLHRARGTQTNILDTIGHGVAIIDYNRDDLPDLVFTGLDQVVAYRNLGGFRFQRVDLGLRQPGCWAGAAIADVNNDGWPDLYLAGYGCAALYLNQHGTFRDVTRAAGLVPARGKYPEWGTSAGFADLDGDSWADLVVCYYLDFGPQSQQRCSTHLPHVTCVCPPKVYPPQRPRVYRNLRGTRFQDVTDAWALRGHGAALGVAFQDADGDGRTDVAVANDERPGDLFLNRGGKFTEIGATSGTAYDRQGLMHGGMGMDWADVDGDRKPDLVVTTFASEDKNLYRNLTGQQFDDVGWRWGITGPTRGDVSFGVRFLDFDNDGRVDLLVASGHVEENAHESRPEESYAEPVRLFHHTGNTFEPVGEAPWGSLVGRAVATADLDNDGGIDAIVTNLEGRPLLLRNVADRGHWLGVRLEGRQSNRMALGARVEVHAGGNVQVFEAHTAGSYMAANDPRLLIGLGAATSVEQLIVRWPGGGQSRLTFPAVDRWVTIYEEASSSEG
ncbi:MAG: CRTAC1 family protein [Armatimonadetes bacterium]|nr:CRTAC1 family protein [Armatimonadota bacterium]